ncbi:MAG: NmrA family NAD(P)-binding protein [Gemmatimonadales bacterium]|nr:NmrA family NAD(P)-binding protein [Gemmatimonadales bacterium]
MGDKKIIAVVGATGAQGGGLVRAILSDKTSPFTTRALTRDLAGPALAGVVAPRDHVSGRPGSGWFAGQGVQPRRS